ncbi:MAG: undecaprenyl-diphosphate phosphatase [Candidatus Saccharimonadales bacterium]
MLIAILLGIIEGVTEFLPISSTGHLIVAEHLLGFKDVQDLFTVVVQIGAIFAVVWFYREDLLSKIVGLFKRETEALNFWKLLIVATIPAGLIGLALDKSMQSITTPLVVALALIVGGIVLWVVDRKPVQRPRRGSSVVDKPDFGKIPLKNALLIGFGQSVAIIPGVSRSGATIVTGLATGLTRTTATAFSFYLSIPVLVLASGLKLVKHGDQLGQLPGGASALVLGLIAAFITALLSVSWLLRYISGHNFKAFAYYRIALGALILLLLAVNVL